RTVEGRALQTRTPTPDELKRGGGLPRHIAIIMDGNGRWAQRRGVPRLMGHRAGREAVREVVKGCVELGGGGVTLYTFSTENWNRPGGGGQAPKGFPARAAAAGGRGAAANHRPPRRHRPARRPAPAGARGGRGDPALPERIVGASPAARALVQW